MSTADIVILCVLGVVTAAVIAYLIYRKKKKGSCCGCCENCRKTEGCSHQIKNSEE